MAEAMSHPGQTYKVFADAITDGLPFRGVHVNTAGDITFVDHNDNTITLTLAEGIAHPIGGKSLTSVTAAGYVIRG